LTNKRIFFLDAELHAIPTLTRDEKAIKEKGVFCVDRVTANYTVMDDLYYCPIPLANVTGLTLDVHYQTIASGWLYRKRPWWSFCFFFIGVAMGLFASIVAMEEWGIFSSGVSVAVVEEGLAGSGSSDNNMELDEEVAATPVESFIAWMESGPFLFGLEQTTFLMLTIGYGAVILGPWMYFKVKVYSRSAFQPKMKQRRQILLGVREPVTQKQKAYKLLLDDKYDIVQIKDYAHLLQAYSPVLAGQVLKD